MPMTQKRTTTHLQRPLAVGHQLVEAVQVVAPHVQVQVDRALHAPAGAVLPRAADGPALLFRTGTFQICMIK